MSADQMILNLFGGIALLLYGMRLMGDGMQNIAGSRMRRILGTLTGNRVMGLGTGALVTALLQSSSATTVMLVGFVSAGFMALEQTLGVILGADIGTTLTVQLIAFNILEYAALLIGIGAALILATRERQYHYVGQAVLGLGFIFLAMRIVGEAAQSLPDSEMFGEILIGLEDAPMLMILIAA
ncbi:MAG: Na/Pi cotransporter family protein, partial [Anaerolineae bacterium]